VRVEFLGVCFLRIPIAWGVSGSVCRSLRETVSTGFGRSHLRWHRDNAARNVDQSRHPECMFVVTVVKIDDDDGAPDRGRLGTRFAGVLGEVGGTPA